MPSLNFSLQPQGQSNWCWAAVAVSVARYLGVKSLPDGTNLTQCALVNDQLGQTTCCTDGDSTDCDQPYFLENALARNESLRPPVLGQISFDDIKNAIDNKCPVCARIEWSGNPDDGHFVVIFGYDDATQSVIVIDPNPVIGGLRTYPLSLFATSYAGAGKWTDTYLTQ